MRRIAPALLFVFLLLPLSLPAAAGKFGAPVGDSPKVALADLVKDAASYSGKTVKTEGVISSVCQEKGCWMILKSGDQSVRVTFKDYGFFVPKDSAGAMAVMEGVFSVKTIPEATAKHYAGEAPGGKPDTIKGDQKELSLVASGVEITRPSRSAARPGTVMAGAASRLLATFSHGQRSRAAFLFESDERTRWHFLPSEMFPHHGVALKELNADQRPAAHALLQTGLSQRGYLAATAIMELERVLRSLEQDGRIARDPEAYYISIFGMPDAEGTWAWRFEGHHLSLHFTIVAGSITVSSPSFFGANPAEIRAGPLKGHRALGAEEDAGRAFVLALTPTQRAQALLSEVAPEDIVTGNKVPIEPLSPVGIRASELSSSQQALLRNVLTAYTSLMADDIAAARWARLDRAGFEKITFAWAGGTEPGVRHYYRVQGPTLLIEYDNTQNDANHIHSVWREFDGDFGRDLLREHVHEVRH
jgi:hypothetical protein